MLLNEKYAFVLNILAKKVDVKEGRLNILLSTLVIYII